MGPMSLTTPTLTTARLRLRPVTEADRDALLAMHTDAEVMRYWDAPAWEGPERAERFVATSRELAAEGSGVRVGIERDGAFVGWVSVTRWAPVHRSAALGYCSGRTARGHGYMTEAAGALLGWAFETFELNRVQAETDTRNLGSARVLEKLGFRREGTLREDCVVDGVVSDSWVFGLLRREWAGAQR
jgi:[ribosomal protein S5]-alanine N-acetyltransferase